MRLWSILAAAPLVLMTAPLGLAQRGTQAGANSTPTFLIGRIMIPGNAPMDVFRTAVKESLAGNM